jgi:hypothetical protein
VTELTGSSDVGAGPAERVLPQPRTGPPDTRGAERPPGAPPPGPGPAVHRVRPAPPPRPLPRLSPWGFIKTYPWAFACLLCSLVALGAANAWLVYKQGEYEREVGRLRHAMSAVERRRADYAFAANKNHFRIMLVLIRRQAEGDRALHLSVALDRGEMYLERDGIRLRAMPVHVGPEAIAGRGPDAVHVAAPRGQRTVASIGPWSITLNGGTTIYADSTTDSLGTSASVTPGNVRITAPDLQAILPNVQAGMSVYFY